MAEFKLSPEADDDLVEIWGYVFEQSFSDDRADRVVRRLYETFARIAEFPNMGSQRDHFGQSVLAFADRAYLILYRVGDGRIEVVRVTGAQIDALPPQ